jgi:hypothetical protein
MNARKPVVPVALRIRLSDPLGVGLAALKRVVPAALLGYATGAALRYGLVEREDLGLLCESLSPPWWCALRLLVIRAFLLDVFGWSSVALAALAWWRRWEPAAWCAVAVGTLGMVLYGFTWSGVGVLGGLLLSARLQADRQQDRETERQHGPTPR